MPIFRFTKRKNEERKEREKGRGIPGSPRVIVGDFVLLGGKYRGYSTIEKELKKDLGNPIIEYHS